MLDPEYRKHIQKQSRERRRHNRPKATIQAKIRKNKVARECRRNWWDWAKMKKGGICTVCGYNDIRLLDFDHRDPTEKTMAVTKIHVKPKSDKKLDIFIDEVNKCQLLCKYCHHLKTHYNLQFCERAETSIMINKDIILWYLR